MRKTKKEYEQHLNGLYNIKECMYHTEHCWAGNNKTVKEKKWAMEKVVECLYGTIIRKLDPIAFEVGYNEWRNNG